MKTGIFILLVSTVWVNLACRSYPASQAPARDYWFTFENNIIKGDYVHRTFLNDTVFIDRYYSRALKPFQGESCCDTLKLVNGSLYYQLKGVFQPYFSVAAFEKRDTVYRDFRPGLTGRNRRLAGNYYVPHSTTQYDGEQVYVFIDPKYSPVPLSKLEDAYSVYFHPKKGIVAYYNGSREGLLRQKSIDDPFKRK